ncbi:P-loop containing nucleoside triphosphate hydrolase protein [Podospora fimiseda]|uniref:P-loop containing nucleoside triphosphate hydrolase protein n=1 Tax=Podospora fimiseda TaxID=252190 RepID=A0AAN6YP02_9PEZI|nr:P-loop containing nucleoside triphosphate hydrolase protein [Podospora fimiseda]
MARSKPRQEIVIAVIGVTGAGKTTFVSKASGRDDLEIGHSIDSCTQDVIPVTFHLNGQPVTLIDTPGFDDSERSDSEILEQVAQYMTTTYQQGIKLTGIILLQPINQPRLQGSELKRTRLFKKLLGEDAYKRVIIATTMWDGIPEAEALSRQHQRETRHEVWGDMVAAGAKVIRHDDTPESARSIIQTLTSYKSPVELQIQRELISNGGSVIETSAGRQLNADLTETINKMSREIRGLQEEIRMLSKESEDRADAVKILEAQERNLRDQLRQRKKLEESTVSFHSFLKTPLFFSHTSRLRPPQCKVIIIVKAVAAAIPSVAIALARSGACVIL